MNRRVITYVRGGLGNQLCSYAAGWLVASKNNADLVLSGAVVGRSKDPSRRFALDRLNWARPTTGEPQVYLRPARWPGVAGFAEITRRQLVLRAAHLSRVDLRNSIASLTGQAEGRTIVLEGHFEDLELARAAVACGLPLPERSDPVQVAEDVADSVGVHVRLGDFRQAWGGAMLLYVDYYAQALEWVAAEAPGLPIRIYSDEPAEAEAMLLRAGANRRMITIDRQFDAAAVLMSLTGHKYKILSRSTLSWWAGLLGRGHDKLVLAPLPEGPGVQRFE